MNVTGRCTTCGFKICNCPLENLAMSTDKASEEKKWEPRREAYFDLVSELEADGKPSWFRIIEEFIADLDAKIVEQEFEIAAGEIRGIREGFFAGRETDSGTLAWNDPDDYLKARK
jgi:hypothetical protein